MAIAELPHRAPDVGTLGFRQAGRRQADEIRLVLAADCD